MTPTGWHISDHPHAPGCCDAPAEAHRDVAERSVRDEEIAALKWQIESLRSHADRAEAAYADLGDHILDLHESIRVATEERDAARAWAHRWKRLARDLTTDHYSEYYDHAGTRIRQSGSKTIRSLAASRFLAAGWRRLAGKRRSVAGTGGVLRCDWCGTGTDEPMREQGLPFCHTQDCDWLIANVTPRTSGWRDTPGAKRRP